MTVRSLPDIELLATTALRADGDVAGLVDTRVYTQIPPNPVWPLIRILRVSGSRPWPRHIDIARVQIDAWAATKRDAWIIVDAALGALHALPGIHDEGVVVAVEDAAGPAWVPDPDTDQPRYTADVLVYSHPHPDLVGS